MEWVTGFRPKNPALFLHCGNFDLTPNYFLSGGSNGGILSLDLDDTTSLVMGIAALFAGLGGVFAGLLSALLGLFTAIDTYFDLLKYAGCPGFDLGFTAVNYLNIFSILLGLIGTFAALAGGLFVGAVFFLIGTVVFLFAYALGAAVSSIFEATCKR